MQQLVERGGLDAAHCLFAIDDTLLDQRHRDFQRRLRGALAGARLQHPQLTALDGEFDVLHVAVMVFEHPPHPAQLFEDAGHDLFHCRKIGFVRVFAGDRQVLRGPGPGHDIFALSIDQVFAVKHVFAGRRIAGEGNTGGAILSHVAEHHRLNIDRRTPVGWYLMQPAIGHSAWVHPRAKNRADCTPQLLAGLLREGMPPLLQHDILEPVDDDIPILGRKIGVEGLAGIQFVVFDQLFEVMMLDAEHDLPVHLDKAAIAVISKALVAALPREPLDRTVVEAEIENGVHHAGHRHARTRANRDQERIVGVAKARTQCLLDRCQPSGDLILEIGRIGFIVLVKARADLGGDRKAGRHRQSEIAHLGKPRSFAAEQVAHLRSALGSAIAECVDPFRHPPLTLRSSRNRRPGSLYRESAPTAAAGSRATSAHRC